MCGRGLGERGLLQAVQLCSSCCRGVQPSVWERDVTLTGLLILHCCSALCRAGVLDPSEYPGYDEEEGGMLANVDAEVGGGG